MSTTTYPKGIIKPANFAWPVMQLDLALLAQIHEAADIEGNQYKLGGKIVLSVSPEDAIGRSVDCSGWVRFLLYHASGKQLIFPDGSVVQHDWIKEVGFKKSSVDSARMRDGALRVAFLTPAAGGGVGHVALVRNGFTLESHGGTGPDSRPWNGKFWQASCHVYVLTPPEVEP